MQPYFFPYLGYFDLIHTVDRWIVADTVQHMRHGWVARNRVLHQTSGWQYIVVPVKKHALQTPIQDIEICETDWRTTMRRQLDHYRKRAPGYAGTMALGDMNMRHAILYVPVGMNSLRLWCYDGSEKIMVGFKSFQFVSRYVDPKFQQFEAYTTRRSRTCNRRSCSKRTTPSGW